MADELKSLRLQRADYIGTFRPLYSPTIDLTDIGMLPPNHPLALREHQPPWSEGERLR
jgi:hypothetical protein